MNKVLIANIFGIGDVLFTTPVAVNLKKYANVMSVDYLCNKRTRAVLEDNPDIDDIIVYEKDDLLSLWEKDKKDFTAEIWSLFARLRRGKYDAVFDFTLSRKLGFLFMAAGIRKRIGLDYRRRGLFLSERIAFAGFEGKHVIEYYLDTLRTSGFNAAEKEMQLVPDEKDIRNAEEYLKNRGAGRGKTVIVVPGGGASWGGQSSRKRWASEKFSAVADMLMHNGIDVIIAGDGSETGLCNGVVEQMDTVPAAVENGMSLSEYIALISASDLVLCNDGGPLHIAVALKVRTVSLFGPVDPGVYGPYPPSDIHKVMVSEDDGCRPCYKKFRLPDCTYNNKCLEDIDPGRVANECLELLGKK